MMGELRSVQIDICGGICTAQLQVVAVGSGQLGPGDLLGITAAAAEIVVVAVLSVHSIPGVRKIDGLPAFGHPDR